MVATFANVPRVRICCPQSLQCLVFPRTLPACAAALQRAIAKVCLSLLMILFQCWSARVRVVHAKRKIGDVPDLKFICDVWRGALVVDHSTVAMVYVVGLGSYNVTARGRYVVTSSIGAPDFFLMHAYEPFKLVAFQIQGFAL